MFVSACAGLATFLPPTEKSQEKAEKSSNLQVASIQSGKEKDGVQFRKLTIGVFNDGDQTDVINGLEIQFKKIWILKMLKDNSNRGYLSLVRPHITVDRSTKLPFKKKLANVRVEVEPGKIGIVDLDLIFNPTIPSEIVVYHTTITLHCHKNKDVVVDNVLISSLRRSPLTFSPKGIRIEHLSEATNYRQLDRDIWS